MDVLISSPCILLPPPKFRNPNRHTFCWRAQNDKPRGSHTWQNHSIRFGKSAVAFSFVPGSTAFSLTDRQVFPELLCGWYQIWETAKMKITGDHSAPPPPVAQNRPRPPVLRPLITRRQIGDDARWPLAHPRHRLSRFPASSLQTRGDDSHSLPGQAARSRWAPELRILGGYLPVTHRQIARDDRAIGSARYGR